MHFRTNVNQVKTKKPEVVRNSLKPGDVFRYRNGKKAGFVYMAISPDGVFSPSRDHVYGVNLSTGNLSRAKATSTTPVDLLSVEGQINAVQQYR